MFDRWIHPKAHFYLNLVGMMLIAIGLPLNKVVLSIGTIWIISNWLLELDFKSKWERFKENKAVWIVLGLYFMHFVGLIWTENFEYAFKDLNAKLPFVVIPFVVGTREHISKVHYNWILKSFLLSLLVTSFLNFGNYYFSDTIKDYRTMSMFGSHIRYGVLVLIGLIISVGYLIKSAKVFRVYWSLPIIWFLFYTLYSQVGTSIILLTILVIGIVIYALTKLKNRTVKFVLFFVPISLLAFIVYEINYVYQDTRIKEVMIDPAERTANGNLYSFATENKMYERGYSVFDYICIDELEREWSKRSNVAYNDTLRNGYPADQVLIRYMTSLGLKKDSIGLTKLSDQDLRNIEQGISSTVKLENPLRKKLYEINSEIELAKSGIDPNGHSILQRMEHAKLGVEILQNNWFFGVGTGDVPDSFKELYEEMDSGLDKKNQHRAHIQVLTFSISFGLIGLLLSILFLGYPINKLNSMVQFLFYLTLLFVFFTSDILETQVGASLTGFFYSLFFITLKDEQKELEF